MKRIPDKVVKKMVSCLDQGMTIRDVAASVGCSPTIVQKYKNLHESGELQVEEQQSTKICKQLDKELAILREKYIDKMANMIDDDLGRITDINPEDLNGLLEKYEVVGRLHKVGKDIHSIGTEKGGVNVNFLSAVKVDKSGDVTTN